MLGWWPKPNTVLPFKDCCGETILPKGWKLNEAGEKTTFEDMVLLMHAEVEKKDSKDTFACNDDAHKAYMGPESHVLRWKLWQNFAFKFPQVQTCRFLPCQLWTQTKYSSMTFLACSKMRCFFQMLVNFVIPDFTITCDVCYFRGDGFRSFEVHLIVSHAVIKASP